MKNITVLLWVSLIHVHLALGQSISLPTVNDNLTNLQTFIPPAASFTNNAIEEVNIFPNGDVKHCSAGEGCGTLPVYLLSFDGKRQNREHALVFWKTTNEINNKGFDVERALGNAKLFEKRGFVTAQENNSNEKKYQFTDDNSFAGTSYYRLKQIDNDGVYTYSKIVAIKGYLFSDSLTIYPNPAKGFLNAGIYVQEAGSATLTLTDLAGKTIFSRPVNLQAGINNNGLNLSAVQSGVYTLKVIRASGPALVRRFVKY